MGNVDDCKEKGTGSYYDSQSRYNIYLNYTAYGSTSYLVTDVNS
jgi:hypothetical protein